MKRDGRDPITSRAQDLPVNQLYRPVRAGTENGHDEPPNVGVSRAAGDGRDEESWRHELALRSRAQVTGCASSVGLHALLGGLQASFPQRGADYAGVLLPPGLIDAVVRR
jgi:hypothetical protein